MTATALMIVFQRLAAEQDSIAADLINVCDRLATADEYQLALHVGDLIDQANLAASAFRRLAAIAPDLTTASSGE